MRAFRILSILVLIVGACGDNLAGTPWEQFEAERDRAICTRLARCGMFEDTQQCLEDTRKRPDVSLRAAVSAGSVYYRGPSAEDCHAALAEVPCDASTREARIRPRACEDMFVGTVEGGGECQLDEECISGTCDVPACAEACCTGSCRVARAFAGIGEPCTLHDDCVPDGYCGEQGSCVPLATSAATCRSDRECDFGLGCIGASDFMMGNCRALPGLGEPCPYLRCADIGATCSEGRCVAVGLAGSPCTSPSDCSPFASCDSQTGRCIDLPRLGEACNTRCAGEAFCDTMLTHRCVSPRANGETCGADDQCVSLDCVEGPIFDTCAEREPCF